MFWFLLSTPRIRSATGVLVRRGFLLPLHDTGGHRNAATRIRTSVQLRVAHRPLAVRNLSNKVTRNLERTGKKSVNTQV